MGLGLGSGAVYSRWVPKCAATWKSLRKLGCEMLVDARCQESNPEHRVSSQQAPHVKKAGTAYVKKRRPGRSRGGASLPAAPIGPCNVNVRNPARETWAGWRGRGAGVEPGVPFSVRPRPSSGLRRDARLLLRPTGALPAVLCHGGTGTGRTGLRQPGRQLPFPCGGVDLARAQRVRKEGWNPRLTPRRATGQPGGDSG